MPSFQKIIAVLRPLIPTWTIAAFLPLPLLLVLEPTDNAEISSLYLGMASAWLATEILRSGNYPTSRSTWWTKIVAICAAVFADAALFIALGILVGVQSNIPFPLMAILSILPAIGLVPCLTFKIRRPFIALVLSAIILLAAKLTGCVVARFVYGPNFIEQGYVSADWNSAKLMISIFWTLTILLSLAPIIFTAACGFKSQTSEAQETLTIQK